MEDKNTDRSKPKLDERFVCSIDGRDFVKYPGLLDLAHQKGISRMEVSLLQLPTTENGNCAICKAEVSSLNGELFSDIGDASPSNCSAKVAKHFLRLASTRAIARALRSYTNIGMTCFEELGDINEVIGDRDNGSRKPRLIKGSQKVVKSLARADNHGGNGKSVEQEPPSPSNGNGNGETKQAATPSKKTQQNPAQGKMSQAQHRALFSLAKRRGITEDEVEAMARETFNTATSDLSSLDAASFIRQLQQSA